jgi:MoaA/NifB/PqqE/SkfB family radical SAM enzyme
LPLCPRGGFTRALGFMDRDVFAAIARECAAHSTALWLHFLGEPLLHRELPELVRCAKEAGVAQVGVSTNATMLTGEIARALLECGLDRLECSLDANDRETYLAMRGKDDFERVVRNVRAFLAAKAGRERPVVSIQFMRTPAVEASLEQLVEAWRPHLGPRDFVMTIAPAGFAGAIADGAEDGAGTARFACPWLFSSLVILHDGTVTMCGADWDARAPLGNVRDSSIAEIWHGAEIERRRALHVDGTLLRARPVRGLRGLAIGRRRGYVNALAEVDRANGVTPRA